MSTFKRLFPVAAIAVGTVAAAAPADVTVRRVNTSGVELSRQTFPNNTPINIDLTAWNDQDWLHVFADGDPNSPSNSIGVITVTGPTFSSLPRINVAAAGGTQTVPITSSIAAIERAGFNFAGLNFAPNVQPFNVRFYGSVAGSFTGEITCGIAERVEARLDINGIHATGATATVPDPDFIGVDSNIRRDRTVSIREVRAGRAITGPIRSDSGDIDLIVVGNAGMSDGNPNNDGILANITIAPSTSGAIR